MSAIDDAERFARQVLDLLVPGGSDPENTSVVERAHVLGDPDGDRLARTALAARLVVLRAELARRDPSPDTLLALGQSVERLKRFRDEMAAVEARRRGIGQARRMHGVPDQGDIADWQKAVDAAVRPGVARSEVWLEAEVATGRKRETMEKYGVINPVAPRRGRKKSTP